MENELKLSSIQPTMGGKSVSREQFELIRKFLGVECLFIAVDDKMHDCKDGCPGHFVHLRSAGFTEPQLRGLSHSLHNDAENISTSHKSQV